MSTVIDVLNSVRFVVGSDGKPVAAQMDITYWRALVDWLEEVEDIAEVREAVARWPTGEGWSDWDDFVKELDAEEVESTAPPISSAD